MTITIPGEPVAKARPRYGNGRIYTPTSDAEKALAWEMKAQHPGPPSDRYVWIIVNFFIRPGRRVDLDNLIKQVLDAGNKVLWEDDSLVRGIVSTLLDDAQEPRTELRILPWADPQATVDLGS